MVGMVALLVRGTPVITPVIANPGQAFEIQAKAWCKHATDLHFYY
jgi:hypothetical protein